MEDLNIKELIQTVRQELIDSENERIQKGLNPLFYVDNLKIEVNFVVEKVKKTGGKFNLKIVDVGRDVTYTNQQVHKITLELKTSPEKNNENLIDSTPDSEFGNSIESVLSSGYRPGYRPGFRPGFLPTYRQGFHPVQLPEDNPTEAVVEVAPIVKIKR